MEVYGRVILKIVLSTILSTILLNYLYDFRKKTQKLKVMNNFKIMRAKEEHSFVIAQINNSRTNVNDKKGFVFGRYNQGEVLKKIESGVEFYLIYNDKTKRFVGFLELSDEIDKRFYSSVDWEVPEYHTIFSKSLKYIRRICVLDSEEAKGARTTLYRNLKISHPDHSFYTFILKRPFNNHILTKFYLKNGFINIGSFYALEYNGFKNYESHVYYLR